MSWGMMTEEETATRIRHLAASGLRTHDLASLFGLQPAVVERITAQSPDAKSVGSESKPLTDKGFPHGR